MPRGDNPNSRKNLKRLSSTEARERGSKGGKASGESRRALKTFKELDDEFTTDEERKQMLEMLKKRAKQGNIKAFETYANYMGLKPADKVLMTEVDSEVIAEVERIVNEQTTGN